MSRSRAQISAIGMVLSGMTHTEVAQIHNIGERSIRRCWYSRHNSGNTLETEGGLDVAEIHRVAKIVIAKSLAKRRQSTRKLATIITTMTTRSLTPLFRIFEHLVK